MNDLFLVYYDVKKLCKIKNGSYKLFGFIVIWFLVFQFNVNIWVRKILLMFIMNKSLFIIKIIKKNNKLNKKI